MLLDGVRERGEDDPELVQLLLERRRHGDAVEDRVDRHARQGGALLEGDAELLVHRLDLRVHLVVVRGLLFRGRVVVRVLVVDRAVVDVRPLRLLHREPVLVRAETPLEEPCRLALLLGDVPDDVLAAALRGELLLDVRDEPVFVLLWGGVLLLEFRLRDHGMRSEREGLEIPSPRDTHSNITALPIAYVASLRRETEYPAEPRRQRN